MDHKLLSGFEQKLLKNKIKSGVMKFFLSNSVYTSKHLNFGALYVLAHKNVTYFMTPHNLTTILS